MSDHRHPESAAALAHAHFFLGDRHDAHERRVRWVLLLTAAMMIVEITAGWLTGSMALLADGWHMATHAAALGIAAIAYSFARRYAHDSRFTFGTGKVGDLAGFASALVLAMIALGIGVESVQRLFAPAHIAYGEALPVAVLGLLVNLASAWLLGGHHEHHEHHEHAADHHRHDGDAHEHHDHNLRSAYLHVLADALTSLLAIGALLAGFFLGWRWMDAATGLVGAIVILTWSWGLLRASGAVLLDASSNPELETEIRADIEDDDARITDLHLWRVGPGRYSAIVSLVADDPLAPKAYADRVKLHTELVHITVETHRCEQKHRSDSR